MKLLAKIILCVTQLFLFADLCHANSEHEMYVGAQKEQICGAPTIEIVGRFLNINEFKVPPNGDYPNQVAIITAAACKTNPANKKITIAAIAYESKKEYIKALVIALVDNVRGKVISSYSGEIGEDAAMRIESGSLWIDTAPYNLRNDVRAFGLDVTSGYIPNCGDGGMGAVRTLYVQEGKKIRPVLEDLTMSYWSFIQVGQSRCTGADAPEESIIENFDLSMSVRNTKTNGYKDLSVIAVSSRDDGKKTNRKPFHFNLLYDGKQYRTEEMQKAFWKWRP
jgi:hypothetical protein